MTDLSRDAKLLVDRARRRDGPSAADRARLRERLDAAWAAHRAERSVEPPSEPAAVMSRGLHGVQPWMSAVLLAALGFLGPEVPRAGVWAGPAAATTAAESHGAGPSQRGSAADEASPLTAAEEGPPLRAAEPERGDGSGAAPRGARGVGARLRAGASRSVRGREAAVDSGSRAKARLSTGSELDGISASTRDRDRRARAEGPSEREAPRREGPSGEVARAPHTRAARSDGAGLHSRAAPEPPGSPLAASADARARPAAGLRQETGETSGEVARTVRERDFVPQAIDDELAWLGAAQDALRKGQPSRALQLVQQHAFRYPDGALAPERSAVQALALCSLQRKSAARVVLGELERRAPSSPLVDRVRRSCGL